jgi:hypothetical protein
MTCNHLVARIPGLSPPVMKETSTTDRVGTTHRLSAVTSVLLLGARDALASHQHERFAELVAHEHIEWNRVFLKAIRHKMLAFMQRAIAERAETKRMAATSTLASMNRRLAMYTLDRAERLKAIVSRMSDDGITVVPYKGIAISQQLYGNIAMRPPGDIDIVVLPKDARHAKEIILEMGYHLSFPIDEDAQDYRLRNRYCEEFIGHGGVDVELHWAFTNQDIRFSIDMDGLFGRLETIDVAGMPMKAFSKPDLLLILAVHGAKHHWECLEYILQIAVIVRDTPEMDWDGVFDHARETGAYRKVLLALRLAHELLGAPLPPDVEQRVYADRRVASVARQVPTLLEEPLQTEDDLGSSASDIFHLHLQDTLADRMRYLYFRATTPSQPENWRIIRAGKYLIPAHAFIRPFRLAWRLIPATFAFMRSARKSKRTPAAA